MRVLFTTCPDRSIFQSMVPLAWALRTAGHEVRVASQPRMADTIARSGLTAVPVGRDHNHKRLAGMEPQPGTAARTGLFRPYDVVDHPGRISWEYLKSGYDYHVTWWHKIDSQPMIPDLVSFARHWRPDLVIWEPSVYAGPIAAKAVGARHARLLWSVDVFGVTRSHYLSLKEHQPPDDRGDALAEWLDAHARKYGAAFDEDMITGQATIDQLPDSLRVAADLDYVPMRYVPYGGPATVPRWLWPAAERPRIAITFGITATEAFDGYVVSVPDILDSLADLDIDVVATVAESEQRKLSHVAANTTVVPYVPLQALVPSCSAVVHHAGIGTLATTSLQGVPQLALPLHFDEPALARKLAEQGAGLAMDPSEAKGDTVRQGVLRLLHEPAFRDSARRLRDEMLAMPDPSQVAARLAEY
ncbi:activator-dependent family glycosyltransferase [Kibdelosporangium persicum]|uniref:Glycosyl transferase, UDP-glucuronosyltransferase n=1 Tax=Kibdelosporangium persicum TaxID=2698649 RepID=A0ABX2F9E0_9PSEU|nr:activator-dependent family glycosyltransferase [Kibdelosporangium persicum]NRN67974.1 Glycosyl transferase, UDP-glucuronosyltransferase [Kibdelosporangium persicum]